MNIGPAQQVLVDFALEHAAALPIAKRVEIYRAIAALIPATVQRTAIMGLADELEEIERKHRQLQLTFLREHDGKGPNQ